MAERIMAGVIVAIIAALALALGGAFLYMLVSFIVTFA